MEDLKNAETVETFEFTTENMRKLTPEKRMIEMNKRGIKVNNVDGDTEPSFLPETFEIVDIKDVDYTINDEIRTSLRLVVKDQNNVLSTCSKGRCSGLFLEMNEAKQFPSPAEIGKDKNGNITLFGKERLSVLPLNPIYFYDLIGKKYTAKKVTVFTVPFGTKFKSKNEALELVAVSSAYKIQEMI